MKGVWGLTAMLLACAAFPAAAGTLYRCVGDDGISQYVSKRISGARCTVAARYRPERPRAATPRPAAAPSRGGPAPATFQGGPRSAGHNAGEGAGDRHGGVPPHRETQTNAQRVGLLADRYRGQTLVAASGAP